MVLLDCHQSILRVHADSYQRAQVNNKQYNIFKTCLKVVSFRGSNKAFVWTQVKSKEKKQRLNWSKKWTEH